MSKHKMHNACIENLHSTSKADTQSTECVSRRQKVRPGQNCDIFVHGRCVRVGRRKKSTVVKRRFDPDLAVAKDCVKIFVVFTFMASVDRGRKRYKSFFLKFLTFE